MTTTTARKKTPRKPLRIRPELLPEGAVYGTFAGREYVMIPVEEFGDWYEEIEDNAAARTVRACDCPTVPFEEVAAELRACLKSGNK